MFTTFRHQHKKTYVRLFNFWVCMCLLFAGLTQVFSVWLRGIYLPEVSNNVVGLRIFYNNQFAFSLPLPAWLMYIIYVVVFLGILGYALVHFPEFTVTKRFAWIFILAGALSNIMERVVYGSVIDYVYVFGGIFNLADAYIIFGILVLLWTEHKRNKNI